MEGVSRLRQAFASRLETMSPLRAHKNHSLQNHGEFRRHGHQGYLTYWAQLKPPFILGSTGFTATCFSSGRTERVSEVHTTPLKWESGFSFSRNRSHSSFPGVSYGPQPPWDLSTILPNHHCFRTSSSTTLVHCSMHESH